MIGIVIAFAAGTAAAYLLGFEDVPSDGSQQPAVHEGSREIIHSPIKGEVKALSEVKDGVFSAGIMGKGFAIEPEEGEVVSPVRGSVTTIFKTKHAIGITSDQGAEILIHIGLDTVKLEGQWFTAHVKEGDKVAPGDPLVSFDLEQIKDAGYDVITPVIVTNTDQYSFSPVKEIGKVQTKEVLLALS